MVKNKKQKNTHTRTQLHWCQRIWGFWVTCAVCNAWGCPCTNTLTWRWNIAGRKKKLWRVDDAGLTYVFVLNYCVGQEFSNLRKLFLSLSLRLKHRTGLSTIWFYFDSVRHQVFLVVRSLHSWSLNWDYLCFLTSCKDFFSFFCASLLYSLF